MLKNPRGTNTVNVTEIFGFKRASDLLYRCEVNILIAQFSTVTKEIQLVALPKFFDGVMVGGPVASVQVLAV